MRILILSCNIGGGHNSCANAIKEVFESNGHYCAVRDAITFISPTASKVLSNGHTLIYRHTPFLLDKGYRYAENHSKIYCKGSVAYRYFAGAGEKLAKYIDTEEFDWVICTHVFAGIMLSEARTLCKEKIICSLTVTDYTCSPTTEICDMDSFFIPHESLTEEFTRHGIPKTKLIPCGIPVRKMFYTNRPIKDAKELAKIKSTHTHLLIMSGSMGNGSPHLIHRIPDEITENEEITVVCGTNKRMCKKLTARYKKQNNVHILGYVEDISLLMDSTDLFLTKPGGISVTEAAVKSARRIF